MRMMSQIRQRRLLQWLFAYVAGAWLLLEFASFLADMFGWPDALLLVFLTLLSFGLPVAGVLSWFHGERGHQAATRPEITLLSGIVALGLLVTFWVGGVATWEVSDDSGSAGAAPGLLSNRGLIRDAMASTEIADPRDAPRALAVLPFRNLGDPDDVHFADGVTEDILFEVSLLPRLRVISRTSTAQYRDSPLSLIEIGQQLDVDLILEGSVRWVEDEARIVAQLIDARTDEHLWSGSYDRAISNILRVQAEVADEVARAVAATLESPDSVDKPDRPLIRVASDRRFGPVDPNVYRLLVDGRRLARSGDPAEVERGVEMLSEVIRREPGLESAVVTLADLLETTPSRTAEGRSDDPADPVARVRTLTRESLVQAKDGTPPRPGRSPAWQLALDEGGLADAVAALESTLVANPNDAGARRWYGLVLAHTGDLEAGLRQLRMAQSVDPNSAEVDAALGSVLMQAGRFDEAAAAFEQAVSRVEPDSPHHTQLRVEWAIARAAAGEIAEALEATRTILAEVAESTQARGALGFLLAKSGQRGEARGILGELQALESEGSAVHLAIAQVMAALGDHAGARAAVERATEASGWAALSSSARSVAAEARAAGAASNPAS